MANEEIRLAIEKRAYQLWEASGYQHGRDQEHWVTAEKEITISSEPVQNTPVSITESQSQPEEKPVARKSIKKGRKSKAVNA